jgi:hypothetical protein
MPMYAGTWQARRSTPQTPVRMASTEADQRISAGDGRHGPSGHTLARAKTHRRTPVHAPCSAKQKTKNRNSPLTKGCFYSVTGQNRQFAGF